MEKCFYCGMPMVNGVCPDCGYSYPFLFECCYLKGVTCIVNKRLCNKGSKFQECSIWHETNGKYKG